MLAILFTALLLATIGQGQVTAAKDSDISGAWILIEQFRDETHAHRMHLEVAGNKITGRSGSSRIEGETSDNVVTMKWLSPDGQRVDATYTGKVETGSIVAKIPKTIVAQLKRE